MSPAPRGLAPCEGLEFALVKMGRAGSPLEPRRRPQAGKSGDPCSQNADSSPRAQGAPGLGRAGRRKGKSEAPRALTACGLGHRVAVDWTWAALFPHALLILRRARRTRSRTQSFPFYRSSASCPSSARTLVSVFNSISNHPPLSYRHGPDEEGKREESRVSASPAAIGGPRRGFG